MANTYKLTATEINVSGSTVLYTAPPSTTSLLKSLYISNISTGSIGIDVVINKSGSAVDYVLILGTSVPTQTSFQPISDTLVLQTGDAIKINCNTISGSDSLLSYLEIT